MGFASSVMDAAGSWWAQVVLDFAFFVTEIFEACWDISVSYARVLQF